MAWPGIFTRHFWLSDAPHIGGLNPRQALVHYLAIPLFLAFLSGWPQVGRTAAWPKYHAMAFWMGMSFSGWWLNDLATRLLAHPLRQLGFPFWATLVIGVFAASFPTDITLRLWVHGYYMAFPYLPLDRPLPGFDISAGKFASTHVYGYLTWPLICLGLFYFWKMPMFGFVPPGEATPQPRDLRISRPSFMAKVPASLHGRVLALASEQHYLRVYTDKGDALILYRLSDAMHELGSKGLQVHRSHWVAAGAVRAVLGSKAAPRLQLVNGLELPVSRSFRQMVEMANFLKADGALPPVPLRTEALQAL